MAVKQRQEAAAASCEKLLMEVYNALCALPAIIKPGAGLRMVAPGTYTAPFSEGLLLH